MLKPIAFANSVTIVGLVLYVVCRALTLVAPDLLFSIGQSWLHTLNLASAKATVPMDFGIFFFGAVTLAIFVWITSYTFAQVYSRFSK